MDGGGGYRTCTFRMRSPATVAPNPEALARGAAVKAIDAGKLDSLPTGPVYIRFIRFPQPVGYTTMPIA
jgi:hypothetical protein